MEEEEDEVKGKEKNIEGQKPVEEKRRKKGMGGKGGKNKLSIAQKSNGYPTQPTTTQQNHPRIAPH